LHWLIERSHGERAIGIWSGSLKSPARKVRPTEPRGCGARRKPYGRNGCTSSASGKRPVRAARAQLIETDWNSAWAEGRGMSLEEALSYALEGEGE